MNSHNLLSLSHALHYLCLLFQLLHSVFIFITQARKVAIRQSQEQVWTFIIIFFTHLRNVIGKLDHTMCFAWLCECGCMRLSQHICYCALHYFCFFFYLTHHGNFIAHNRKTFGKVAVQIAALFATLMRGVNVVGLVLALCPILYFSLFIMANCFCFTQIMRYMDEKMMRYKLSLYVFSIAHNRKTFDKVAVQIAALFAILMRGVNVVGLVLTLCPILYFSFLIVANLFFVHRWMTCDDDI